MVVVVMVVAVAWYTNVYRGGGGSGSVGSHGRDGDIVRMVVMPTL